MNTKVKRPVASSRTKSKTLSTGTKSAKAKPSVTTSKADAKLGPLKKEKLEKEKLELPQKEKLQPRKDKLQQEQENLQPEKTIIPNKHKRILTAEGWKRSVMKKAKKS